VCAGCHLVSPRSPVPPPTGYRLLSPLPRPVVHGLMPCVPRAPLTCL
jgi:hypothetical protein